MGSPFDVLHEKVSDKNFTGFSLLIQVVPFILGATELLLIFFFVMECSMSTSIEKFITLPYINYGDPYV